jgi:hypothetical protein
MLLQTNSYIVPKEKRAEHARLMRRFRQILHRIGCDNFEVYEQVGANWGSGSATGRFVQIMRFRDRKHQLAVQNAERTDPTAQQLIAEFCELVNYPYQQQNGLFAVGYYSSVLPVAPARVESASEGGGESAVAAQETGPAEGQPGEVSPEDFASAAAEEQGGTYEQMPLDEPVTAAEESPEVEQLEHIEEAPAATEDAPTEEAVAAAASEPVADEPAVDESDDWSLMNEARVIDVADDEEALGVEIQSEGVDHHGGTPPPIDHAHPANGEGDVELSLEDDDDLARLARQLAESDDAQQSHPKPPRRGR